MSGVMFFNGFGQAREAGARSMHDALRMMDGVLDSVLLLEIPLTRIRYEWSMSLCSVVVFSMCQHYCSFPAPWYPSARPERVAFLPRLLAKRRRRVKQSCLLASNIQRIVCRMFTPVDSAERATRISQVYLWEVVIRYEMIEREMIQNAFLCRALSLMTQAF